MTEFRCDGCGKPGHVYLCPPCAAEEAAYTALQTDIAAAGDGLPPVDVAVSGDNGSPFTLDAWAQSDGYRWGQP